MVTLHHFASPDYLTDVGNANAPQAWERAEMAKDFATFAGRMAARWGAEVDYWTTINEPVNLALGGYLQGSFPPGQLLATERMLAVIKAEARAHAAAYDAIHQADTVDADGDGKAAFVSLAAHQRTFHPYEDGDPEDIAAAARVEYVFNTWILEAIVKGNWDDDFDGALTGPKDVTADPALVGRADFLGVNYYSDTLVSAHRGLLLPVINAAVYLSRLPTQRPKTELGWDIYPEGFGTVLDKVGAYGLPVIVTENGLADAQDVNRSRFLLEHLYEVGWALARGVPVIGYFHWSLVDNFEWANGYCPHFGLLAYDRTTGARTAKPSMTTYRGIIASAAVQASDVRAAPPYRPPTMICE
jgi:beta-glucosidase